jgi:hypothetical protein
MGTLVLTVYDYQLSLDQARRQRRRRRIMLAGLIVLLVLLANLLVLASMDSPELSIQSMSLDRIDISNNRLYVSLYLAVFNVNSMDSYLSGVEGKVISGGVVLDRFSFDDSVQIGPHVNMTVQYSIAVDDAPLPLSDPVLKVEGKARVRSWIQGITYHYAHSIPLTHSPDLDNQPPVADINGPLFARRGHPAAFDGTDSYDPDGKVVGWTWDFGDGQRAEGARVEHTFLSQGMYTIRLTVVDQMGVRSGTTMELRVLPL